MVVRGRGSRTNRCPEKAPQGFGKFCVSVAQKPFVKPVKDICPLTHLPSLWGHCCGVCHGRARLGRAGEPDSPVRERIRMVFGGGFKPSNSHSDSINTRCFEIGDIPRSGEGCGDTRFKQYFSRTFEIGCEFNSACLHAFCVIPSQVQILFGAHSISSVRLRLFQQTFW